MIHFSVNGKEIDFNTQPEGLVHDLMEKVRQQFNSENSLVSSIRINGNELLDSEDEAALEGVKISEIDTMEIITSHPRELAEETLQALIEFTGPLETLCLRAAESMTQYGPKQKLDSKKIRRVF